MNCQISLAHSQTNWNVNVILTGFFVQFSRLNLYFFRFFSSNPFLFVSDSRWKFVSVYSVCRLGFKWEPIAFQNKINKHFLCAAVVIVVAVAIAECTVTIVAHVNTSGDTNEIYFQKNLDFQINLSGKCSLFGIAFASSLHQSLFIQMIKWYEKKITLANVDCEGHIFEILLTKQKDNIGWNCFQQLKCVNENNVLNKLLEYNIIWHQLKWIKYYICSIYHTKIENMGKSHWAICLSIKWVVGLFGGCINNHIHCF